jgi:DNA-binding MarR family transcriptional regulator
MWEMRFGEWTERPALYIAVRYNSIGQEVQPVAVSDADYEALAAFRRGLREFLAFSEAQARAAGLTPQQHQALLAIRGAPGRALSIGALADDLILKPHSALELSDRLVAAGFVLRTADPTDRRRVTLTLTRKAQTLLARLSAAHLTELDRQQSLLRNLMRRLEKR